MAPAVMVSQIRYMIDVLRREPRFTLHVLPVDARLSPGRLPASAYMIYTFPDPGDPPMVVAETTDFLALTGTREVEWYERLHNRLRQATLPALESLSLLADAADRLSNEAGPNVKQQYSGWRKSSYSVPDSNCVEVGRSADGTIGVRDTKQDGRGPVLDFTLNEWTAFLQLIRSSLH